MTYPRSILVKSRRCTQNSPRRVHFENLDWEEEAKRSERGQVLRKELKRQLLMERTVRHQEHRDRKKALDVFRSNNPWVQMQVNEMLNEDDEPKFFTRGLETMLHLLGAPPGDVASMLQWLRYSSIQYTKYFRYQYELVDNYLLYLGRTDLFQRRFFHVPPSWLFCGSSFSPTCNDVITNLTTPDVPIPTTNRCQNNIAIETTGCYDTSSRNLLDMDLFQNPSTFDTAYGFHKATTTCDKPRGARFSFRRAFEFFWLAMSQRRCLDLLWCAKSANVVDTTSFHSLEQNAPVYQHSDKRIAKALEPPVFYGVLT